MPLPPVAGPSNLLILAQTAAGWSWQTEAEALYWHVARLGYPSRGPALKTLWSYYNATGSTAGLLRVAREQYSDAPKDPGVRNNFAFLSLVSGIGNSEAGTVAKEDFQQYPGDPNVAATYAYALYLEGRYKDGLRILSPFGEQRLQASGTALYLALLQEATGNKDAASHSAATVDPRNLLPEERLLLNNIRTNCLGTKTPPVSHP